MNGGTSTPASDVGAGIQPGGGGGTRPDERRDAEKTNMKPEGIPGTVRRTGVAPVPVFPGFTRREVTPTQKGKSRLSAEIQSQIQVRPAFAQKLRRGRRLSCGTVSGKTR